MVACMNYISTIVFKQNLERQSILKRIYICYSFVTLIVSLKYNQENRHRAPIV